MSDLVERLRALTAKQIEDNLDYILEADKLSLEAAAEIVRLTAERDAALAKLAQYEQAPVFYADARELAAARLGEGDEVWMQTKPYNYDDVQLIARPEASHDPA